MATDKKKAVGQYTHWARPRWIRMYSYNYEFGESYYRPQVRYLSTSRVASDTTSYAEARQAYQTRRRTVEPPRAQSFIERWADEPFYGYGFRSTAATRRASSESRSTSNYASSNVRETSLSRNVRESSLSQASSSVQQTVRQRRARSVEAAATYSSDAYNASAASDDCLMRSTALDSRYSRARSVSRAAREQSYSSELDASSQSAYNSRFAREGSLTKRTLNVDDQNILRGTTFDGTYNYEYPKQHLVCTERCPLFADPIHHRRFVIGSRFGDAAALGGFDVLYDPTVFSRTRTLLKRCSEERDLDETSYQRAMSSSRDTQSQSRRQYTYNTIY